MANRKQLTTLAGRPVSTRVVVRMLKHLFPCRLLEFHFITKFSAFKVYLASRFQSKHEFCIYNMLDTALANVYTRTKRLIIFINYLVVDSFSICYFGTLFFMSSIFFLIQYSSYTFIFGIKEVTIFERPKYSIMLDYRSIHE